jgi:hypothetical protein
MWPVVALVVMVVLMGSGRMGRAAMTKIGTHAETDRDTGATG